MAKNISESQFFPFPCKQKDPTKITNFKMRYLLNEKLILRFCKKLVPPLKIYQISLTWIFLPRAPYRLEEAPKRLSVVLQYWFFRKLLNNYNQLISSVKFWDVTKTFGCKHATHTKLYSATIKQLLTYWWSNFNKIMVSSSRQNCSRYSCSF